MRAVDRWILRPPKKKKLRERLACKSYDNEKMKKSKTYKNGTQVMFSMKEERMSR